MLLWIFPLKIINFHILIKALGKGGDLLQPLWLSTEHRYSCGTAWALPLPATVGWKNGWVGYGWMSFSRIEDKDITSHHPQESLSLLTHNGNTNLHGIYMVEYTKDEDRKKSYASALLAVKFSGLRDQQVLLTGHYWLKAQWNPSIVWSLIS